MENECSETKLQIRFITKQSQYAIPDTVYSVDSNLSTAGLNSLVKGVLADNSQIDSKKLEFDFLVFGELLRVPLLEQVKSKGSTTESTVDVEYLLRVPAPKPLDCLTHDDWVASVSCKSSWIVTGCYDNSLHIWSTKGAHTLAIPGHSSPVKTVSWMALNDTTGSFISGSHDQTAMIWEWDLKSNSVECVVSCKGHDKSVECLDIAPDLNNFATGSWDNTIKIWSARVHENEESSSKRPKTEQGKSRTPLATYTGHREAVSAVRWLSGSNVISSCSWDHTLRLWDVELQAPTRTIAANKSFFNLDWSQNNGLLVTASADRVVRVYDPRSNVDSPTVCTRGHMSWVSAVKWSPKDENLFLSAGHDTLLKMWDIRSPNVALYELTGHQDKVLCCDWHGKLLVSGGTDNTLRIFKTKSPVHHEATKN